jgi:hypothetical protein
MEDVLLPEDLSVCRWAIAQIASCDQLIEVVMAEAQRAVDDFWVFRNEKNERFRHQPKERSRLGARVREAKGYYSVEWFHDSYYQDRSGKWATLSHYIRKGQKGHSYLERNLIKHAQTWEIEVALGTERQLAHFRLQYSSLVMLRKNMRKLVVKIEKSEDDLRLYGNGLYGIRDENTPSHLIV